MTHNKYLMLQLKKDNHPISVKNISLNLTQIFLLLNFLIICLYYSSVSSSFTLALDPVVSSKNLYTGLPNVL